MALKHETFLVLGGARSGKSRHAQSLAEAAGLALAMIATARAGDAEMEARIARHRADRGASWQVVEEPIDVVGALERWRDPGRVVVVDCLTLWLSNLMEAGASLEAETERLTRELALSRGPVILVSNEVGFGLVPMTELGRAFRDAQGWLNQAVARACACAVLIVAGLPLSLKP